MPFWWDMAYYCLNLRDGTVRHFPSGSYDKQAATAEGLNELRMMEATYQAWRTFKTSAAKWGNLERRVAKLAMPEPGPGRTRRYDWLINRLWPASIWTRTIISKLRGLKDG